MLPLLLLKEAEELARLLDDELEEAPRSLRSANRFSVEDAL
jgi:hypothetical protein